MLPVLNKEILAKAVLASVALRGEVNEKITFDRKHKFDADCP
jgi:Asp-tRNA(Asn)/Glu-tRNA(Gln) amidotransferase B subunit